VDRRREAATPSHGEVEIVEPPVKTPNTVAHRRDTVSASPPLMDLLRRRDRRALVVRTRGQVSGVPTGSVMTSVLRSRSPG
jgi:hypothetical protein